MKNLTIIYVSLTLIMVKYCLGSDPVIEFENSKIFGKSVFLEGKEVNQFLSVPYAQPPIGQLRFRKPQPIQNYPNEIHALNSPPACPQYTEKPFPSYDNFTGKSEDCLYLNIWTPSNASDGNKKAVLYWIYGGGFSFGSIRLPLYTGTAFAALGDIIVVTVNYRVGPLGFLTSNSDDAPGNVALYDMLEGLKWVNKYIGYFGGDTSRITIAGESSGSISIGIFGVSPLAKGLYQREIMESGSPTYLASENNMRNLATSQTLAEALGCANSTFNITENPGPVVDCLRRVDPQVLAKTDYDLNLPMFPMYGDEMVPVNPRIAIMNGNFNCTELLIGVNKNEGSYLLSTRNQEIFGFFGEKNTLINKTTGRDFIRLYYSIFPGTESVVQYYLPDSLPENAGPIIRYQTFTSMGDMLLTCPDVYQAEKCAEIGGKVYHYFFTHRPSNTPYAPWMGVAHFEEVKFVFGQPIMHRSNYTEEEQILSEQMIEIWSSFVKDGKPSIPWPLYSKENPVFKFLGPKIVTGVDGIGPHKDNCDFLRPGFKSV